MEKHKKKVYKTGSKRLHELNKEKDTAKTEEEKQKVDIEISKTLMMERSNNIESQVNAIKSSSNSRQTKVFKMKKIISSDKQDNLPESVVETETGKPLLTKEEIKNATLKHCTDLLQNNQPDEKFLDEFLVKNKNLELELESADKGESEGLSEMEFGKQIEHFKKKQTASYDFITKAGDQFKSLVYKIACKIWESEDIPEGWNTTNLVKIFKRVPTD